MKRALSFQILVAACLVGACGSVALAGDLSLDERAAQSRKAVKTFATDLKSKLVAGMKSGGPVAAISVCNSAAPEIADKSAKQTGWSVGRTALKLRNQANAPDEFERKVLEDFVAKRQAGADPKTLEHFEVAIKDGVKVFRYMKAIPTGSPCLACHGKAISGDVQAAIKALYPDDAATGFGEGDIRGAFTIVQPIK